MQFSTTSDGVPLEFCRLPERCANLQGLAEFVFDLPETVELSVDGDSDFYDREDYLQDCEAFRLQVSCRIISKRSKRTVNGNL